MKEARHRDQKVYDIFDICRTLCKSDKKMFYDPCESFDVVLHAHSNFVLFEKLL